MWTRNFEPEVNRLLVAFAVPQFPKCQPSQSGWAGVSGVWLRRLLLNKIQFRHIFFALSSIVGRKIEPERDDEGNDEGSWEDSSD
jgi:hypothetical protein